MTYLCHAYTVRTQSGTKLSHYASINVMPFCHAEVEKLLCAATFPLKISSKIFDQGSLWYCRVHVPTGRQIFWVAFFKMLIRGPCRGTFLSALNDERAHKLASPRVKPIVSDSAQLPQHSAQSRNGFANLGIFRTSPSGAQQRVPTE